MAESFIEHIGWITDQPELFEKFWVDVLGYERIKIGFTESPLQETLFGFPGRAEIRRYRGPIEGPDVEIHVFEQQSEGPLFHDFNRIGLNHICISTGEAGSRQALIDRLPEELEVKIYDNPGGWKNVFIRDYEGNWIELRERY